MIAPIADLLAPRSTPAAPPTRASLDAAVGQWPKPIWFTSHRTALRLARQLVRFEAAPSMLRLAAMLPRAVVG